MPLLLRYTASLMLPWVPGFHLGVCKGQSQCFTRGVLLQGGGCKGEAAAAKKGMRLLQGGDAAQRCCAEGCGSLSLQDRT